MRGLIACTALVGLTLLGGCRVCESGDDCAYPLYGGSWERTNRNHGRVGSIFAPAGAKVAGSFVPPVTQPADDRSDEQSESDPEFQDSFLDDFDSEMPELEIPEPLDEVDQT